MKRCITIFYIDDRIDPILARYLNEYCDEYNRTNSSDYSLYYDEYTFEKEDTYKTLLKNDSINKANIIVIDSRLFENENSNLSKFTGEQFKVILKQILPFIKTIVISQNYSDEDSLTVQKYQSHWSDVKFKDHYDEILEPIIKQNIIALIEEYKVIDQLEEEDEVDSVLVGTIQSTILGLRDSALFEKEDLDELIKLFNEVKITYED
ncbi:hypothetical protein P5G61_09710 [Paenibacillus sp. F6_3S_P_1C]|uniref:Uncharacterized protein n=1 Tax=Paenibacillus vandeheii TaxID=3035917 RepID=A0ABT8JBA6_9BACL|nr:hypothetical protein [Paenibacillus vandeheii]MDN4601499.1 hypothetical protein [Paenibacillus vandeheii]